jgi:hypothetical protein
VRDWLDVGADDPDDFVSSERLNFFEVFTKIRRSGTARRLGASFNRAFELAENLEHFAHELPHRRR